MQCRQHWRSCLKVLHLFIHMPSSQPCLQAWNEPICHTYLLPSGFHQPMRKDGPLLCSAPPDFVHDVVISTFGVSFACHASLALCLYGLRLESQMARAKALLSLFDSSDNDTSQ